MRAAWTDLLPESDEAVLDGWALLDGAEPRRAGAGRRLDAARRR
nr:hypothetical protein [Angustibacter aerolatus]